MLAVSLPWYLAVAQANPEEFVDSFIFLHNVERFTSTVSAHYGPWFYYIPVLFLGTFPWSLFIPGLVTFTLRKKSDLPLYVRYANLWFWVVFLFFSAAGTKLLTYILPGLPAFALLMGWYWYRLIDSPAEEVSGWVRRVTQTLLLIVGIAFFGALIVMMINPNRMIPAYIADIPVFFFLKALAILIVIVFGITFYCFSRQSSLKRSWQAVAIGMTVVMMYTNIFVLPGLAGVFQSDLMAFVKRTLEDKAALATFKTKKPSLVYYYRQPIYYIEDDQKKQSRHTKVAKTLHQTERSLYLILKNRDLPSLSKTHPMQPILSGSVYSLVKAMDPLTLNIKEARQ